jgi:two-component system, OmpR family, response regulator PhoP|tara:strand:+ start:2990 stop:3676 length:687 start_codon:yes stop_codon:yes gene_type:complete
MVQRVLLAEDDEVLRGQLIDLLTTRQFVVESFGDGAAALDFGLNQAFDLAVIDLGLPKLPGLDVVKALRSAGLDQPILILTARADWHDKVQGLEAGADDYLVKPFHIEELVARLGALSRRAGGALQTSLSLGPLSMDVKAKSVLVTGQALTLTAYEYGLLHLLLRRPGQIVSKSELSDHLYQEDLDRDSNVIEVFVGRLRRKLAAVTAELRIETHRGQGYRLIQQSAS